MDDTTSISAAQAARMLDVTPNRIRQLMELGQLPFTRCALGRLINPTDVEVLRTARAQRRAEREAVVA